jgi:hypothetical protein
MSEKQEKENRQNFDLLEEDDALLEVVLHRERGIEPRV